jgi:hypothetical protein
MKIDLDKYAGERREQLTLLGRPYASDAVQDVAGAFMNALVLHGPALMGSGYVDEDGERLAALYALSKAELVARPELARERTDARKAARLAVKASKRQRLDARTMLEVSLDAAKDDVEGSKLEPYRTILSQTATAGADAAALKLQLIALADAFDLPALKTYILARNGAGLGAQLRTQAEQLDRDHHAALVRQGTPEHTAKLDLIDGLLIERLRAIRKIARRASTRVGDPTIADAFSLAALD